MEFTKMHGLGNDYIYLNCMEDTPDDPGELARKLSDRHFGIGGDGLICICPSGRADFRMRMFNADGSEGAMCGNGIRCVGKYVYDKGLTHRTELSIETAAGLRRLTLWPEQGKVERVTVAMGAPEVGAPLTLTVGGRDYTGIPVSMGNPHFVLETADPAALDLEQLGPGFERHPAFPHRTNTEFVRTEGRRELRMRVWERGSGETLACGTGACAASAAMISLGKLDRQVTVHLPGGDLSVEWSPIDGQMYMTGATVAVFDGKLAD